jgi:hypothetical protein
MTARISRVSAESAGWWGGWAEPDGAGERSETTA